MLRPRLGLLLGKSVGEVIGKGQAGTSGGVSWLRWSSYGLFILEKCIKLYMYDVCTFLCAWNNSIKSWLKTHTMDTRDKVQQKCLKADCSVVMAAQVYKCTEHHWIVQLQWVNFVAFKFYLNKVLKVYI